MIKNVFLLLVEFSDIVDIDTKRQFPRNPKNQTRHTKATPVQKTYFPMKKFCENIQVGHIFFLHCDSHIVLT